MLSGIFTSRVVLIVGATLITFAAHSPAVTITNVGFYQNVTYASNSVLYPLPTVVALTVGAGDFAGGFLAFRVDAPAINTPFDFTQLFVPANLAAGTNLVYQAPFRMGCTNAQEVFGPLQTLNNAAATVIYNFPTLPVTQNGSNVSCAMPGIGPVQPDYENPTVVTPTNPPYNPYQMPPLTPAPYLNANGQPYTIVDPVPEPISEALAAAGLLIVFGAVRRRHSNKAMVFLPVFLSASRPQKIGGLYSPKPCLTSR